jgi:hypothetical protein
MKPFVIIFRQAQDQLTPSDLEARSREMPAWVEAHNSAGHQLEPRILAPEGRSSAPMTGEAPLSALLFIQARDIDQAMGIARSHPGVRYGASVEVRPRMAPPAR